MSYRGIETEEELLSYKIMIKIKTSGKKSVFLLSLLLLVLMILSKI